MKPYESTLLGFTQYDISIYIYGTADVCVLFISNIDLINGLCIVTFLLLFLVFSFIPFNIYICEMFTHTL